LAFLLWIIAAFIFYLSMLVNVRHPTVTYLIFFSSAYQSPFSRYLLPYTHCDLEISLLYPIIALPDLSN